MQENDAKGHEDSRGLVWPASRSTQDGITEAFSRTWKQVQFNANPASVAVPILVLFLSSIALPFPTPGCQSHCHYMVRLFALVCHLGPSPLANIARPPFFQIAGCRSETLRRQARTEKQATIPFSTQHSIGSVHCRRDVVRVDFALVQQLVLAAQSYVIKNRSLQPVRHPRLRKSIYVASVRTCYESVVQSCTHRTIVRQLEGVCICICNLHLWSQKPSELERF